jgi:hypothetical protein
LILQTFPSDGDQRAHRLSGGIVRTAYLVDASASMKLDTAQLDELKHLALTKPVIELRSDVVLALLREVSELRSINVGQGKHLARLLNEHGE